MLTGQAKTDYQREYMRRRRSKVEALGVYGSNAGSNKLAESVRPSVTLPVRPNYQHQVHCNAARFSKPFTKGTGCSCRPVISEQAKPQSYNPMMVGYVPPRAVK